MDNIYYYYYILYVCECKYNIKIFLWDWNKIMAYMTLLDMVITLYIT